jgi:UDP-N-acetyl-D-glucosamine dehydrogenase
MTDELLGLRTRITDRTARIGVVGLGYVGLPTAVALAEAGFQVIGIDIADSRCSGINAGRSHIEDVDDGTLARLVGAGRLRAVAAMRDAGDLDVLDICVPTPLDKSRDPDVSAILAVISDIRGIVRAGQLLILTSTTYPGTTVELLQPAIEAAGLTVGRDVFIAFAPERIDPGNTAFGMHNTPKVVGGVTTRCTEVATALLETIVDNVVPVSGPTAAEMTKLLENTFRSVNIALANEVAIMCRHLDLDVWEVIAAAATKPYGFMPFYPGPGLGGHCIPVDPSYLSWKLRRLNYTARFISLADDINQHMPEFVVGLAARLLNEQSKSVRGSRILVVGVAYKPDVGDLRESPALDVLELLRRQGADVCYADPHIPGPIELEGGALSAVELSPTLVQSQDLIVVTTAHAAFDWTVLRKYAQTVLDTRGWSRGQSLPAWHTL